MVKDWGKKLASIHADHSKRWYHRIVSLLHCPHIKTSSTRYFRPIRWLQETSNWASGLSYLILWSKPRFRRRCCCRPTSEVSSSMTFSGRFSTFFHLWSNSPRSCLSSFSLERKLRRNISVKMTRNRFNIEALPQCCFGAIRLNQMLTQH